MRALAMFAALVQTFLIKGGEQLQVPSKKVYMALGAGLFFYKKIRIKEYVLLHIFLVAQIGFFILDLWSACFLTHNLNKCRDDMQK